jgi:hypothetical protein
MLRWLVEAVEEVGSTFHFLVDEHQEASMDLHGVSHTIHNDGVGHTVETHDPSETILVDSVLNEDAITFFKNHLACCSF